MDDGSAICRRCLDRACGVRGRLHGPHVLQRLCAAAAVCARGLVGYVHRQLGLPIASTAPLARITDAFDKAVRRFARDHELPWVDFAKGQRKDDVMHEHLARFTGTEGVLFIGRAQEKTKLFRTEKRRDANGDSYPWIVKPDRAGQPLLLLLRRRRFRPVLPQVLLLLPVQRQAVHQRPRVGQTPGRQGRDRVRGAGQRVRRGRGPGGAAGDLRPARTRADRCAAAQVADHPAAPVQPRRIGPPATATSCRFCRPSSRLTQMLDKPVARVGCSSSRSSATTSTSAAPTRSR